MVFIGVSFSFPFGLGIVFIRLSFLFLLGVVYGFIMMDGQRHDAHEWALRGIYISVFMVGLTCVKRMVTFRLHNKGSLLGGVGRAGYTLFSRVGDF